MSYKPLLRHYAIKKMTYNFQWTAAGQAIQSWMEKKLYNMDWLNYSLKYDTIHFIKIGCSNYSIAFNILCLSVSLAADAYCLLDVYLTLSKDPKGYGLQEDFRTIPSTQTSKSRKERKPKDKSNKAKRREVCLPAYSPLIR